MAIKKSDLYTSFWASCNELRGGMDASQYKDYVLFLLFIKYISDKYDNSDDLSPSITIPPGASFKDMITLKGKSDIGDKINTQIIQPLIDSNTRLARSDFPNFNDPKKLGEGPALVERLSNLIGIFQNPVLDFSQNCAEEDEILGDVYEFLMRHFANESCKRKGQFYTPSEVSCIIAKHDAGGKSRPTWPSDSKVIARFSKCGRFRYELSEIWDKSKPIVLWILMNPSVACVDYADPTLIKTGKFARSWGYGGQLIGNVHAYRSTNKKGLLQVEDPVGPENDKAIRRMARRAQTIVLAYGHPPKSLKDRGRKVVEMLSGHPALCYLKLAKDGSTPWHPLYLPGNLRPIYQTKQYEKDRPV